MINRKVNFHTVQQAMKKIAINKYNNVYLYSLKKSMSCRISHK